MAGLQEQARWENQIYRIEENDPVHGGEDGITNKPLKQLGNRTLYLKQQITQNNLSIQQKVSLAGNERVSGEKTFINRLKAHNGLKISYTYVTADQGHYAEMFADSNTTWLNYKGRIFRWHADGHFSVDNKKFFGEGNKPRFADIVQKPTTLDGYATRFNGIPYIQATSGWVGIDFGVSQGHWRLEFNPNSHNEADRRLNLFYRNGNATTYLSFPTIGTGETMAYRSWVDSRIQSLINASPSNLDTLKELAAALGNDANFSRTVLTKIAGVETKTATAQNTANNANRNADGRVSKSGATMTGVLEIDNAANFVRGKQGSTHKWYIGKGSSSSNDTAFYNYSHNYGIVLQADRVQLGKQPYVGEHTVNHSGLGYLSATTSNYGGIGIERPDRNDRMLVESNGDRFAFIRRNRSNGQNHYALYTPKANGTFAYQGSDNIANLNTLTGSTFFKCTGNATGLPSGWSGSSDYNGIQADGGHQRFQILVAGQDDIALRVNDSTGDSTSWSEWSRLMARNNIAVLTGTITHGGTIPLPAGFTEAQCKWFVSINNSNRDNAMWDIKEGGGHNHFRLECWTHGRTVHARQFRHDDGRQNYHNMTANYLIIGVK